MGKIFWAEWNEHITYPNVWDVAKAEPTGQFLAVNAYIRK